MPLGMERYECDPVYGICEGGFGGGNPKGFAWAVTNVPDFRGYYPREPGGEIPYLPVESISPPPSVPASPYQLMAVSHAPAPLVAQPPAGTQVPTWLLPALIIAAVLLLSGK
jgi:hypothetical protein